MVFYETYDRRKFDMVKVGIIGATGYAGGELVRILLRHRDVEIKWYGSRSYIDKKYAEVYQNMFELVEDKCLDDNIEKLAGRGGCDLYSDTAGLSGRHPHRRRY